jgi:3'-phosphoadenosine 5'-phosphosulfate (PAPS) 3'-phosphatase
MAQRLISTGFSVCFPALRVIGEENVALLPGDDSAVAGALAMDAPVSLATIGEGDGVPVEDCVCYVDPLDGTWSFVHNQLEQVTTLIGWSSLSVSVSVSLNLSLS